MNFLLFRRADSAHVVVPDMFQPPPACGGPGELQVLGRCQLDLGSLSSRAVADLGIQGYALVEARDFDVLQALVQAQPSPSQAILEPG